MKLDAYLSKHGLSQADFARLLSDVSDQSVGACAALVNRIVNDNHIPRPETVAHIVILTNGKVEPNDLYALDETVRAAK